jgi:hypothetical protein
MTVYVESNFVLEHALEQEECEHCEEFIRLASSGQIVLAVPAFSLAEPHTAILGKEKARTRLNGDLRAQFNDLGRSKRHHTVPLDFQALASVLIASAQMERDGLRETAKALLQTADIISLDNAVLSSALDIQSEFGMSGQDAIVLASVLSHLINHHPAESCFLNRNSKDFDDPEIRSRLGAFGCRFFTRFEDGAGFVSSRIGAR